MPPWCVSLRVRVKGVPSTCAAVHKVLRLTAHLLLQPSPAQLASQAEVIADLTFQRNMLLLERSQDCARWQAEREHWSRTAEVLCAKARVAQEPLAKEQVRYTIWRVHEPLWVYECIRHL